MIERACFEVGIKLGTIFHQFVGIPIGLENVDIVEKAIESCIKLQPYVRDVKVEIDRKKLEKNLSKFGYTTLSQEMIKAEVLVDVEGSKVKGILRWVDELRYPLMDFEPL